MRTGMRFAVFFTLILSIQCAPKGDSVSGISAGAYMATQYQFAFSKTIVGAAIFAGGPYYCAMGQATLALTVCMTDPFLINLIALESAARISADASLIDPISALASHNVFLFSGSQDSTVDPGVVKHLQTMYEDLGVKNIVTNFTTGAPLTINFYSPPPAAGHSFPTLSFGNPCGSTASPYITNCGYDGAGEALQTIYGKLKPPVEPIAANLKKMSIAPFTPGGLPSALSLDDRLYYYEPTNCHGNCSVHVSFAGCSMTFDDVGDVFPAKAGYNRWAEANDIVILYPFVIKSYLLPFNPNGCWDWWGYLSPNYEQKLGPQIITINRLIAHFKN